jgi:hypothetical protein
MSKGGGGGGGDQEVTVKPWGPTKPYLQDILGQAGDLYYNYRPEYFPQSTVAPLSPYSNMAIDLTASRALSGSPLTRAAQGSMTGLAGGGFLGGSPAYQGLQNYFGSNISDPAINHMMQTAEGGFLNRNPYIDEMYGQAAGNVVDQFTSAISPGTDAAFSRAGRTGSPAYASARNTIEETLGDTLGGLATNIYGGNYATERQNQLQAQQMASGSYNQYLQNQLQAGGLLDQMYGRDVQQMMGAANLAPGLADVDYQDLSRLGLVGEALTGHRQQQLNDMVNRWNYSQTGPGSLPAALQQYAGYVWPTAGLGQTQQTNVDGPSNFQQGLGGAASGAAVGSIWGPWGAAIGGGLGLLGGLF